MDINIDINNFIRWPRKKKIKYFPELVYSGTWLYNNDYFSV